MNQTNRELYEKLRRLQWLLHKQQIKTHAAGGPMADTSRGQGRILAVLKMKDGISTKDLSYLLGIRVSSLNELLAKLEKGGYITRESSAADKRVMLIHLTEKGREEERPEKERSDVLACLSAEEQVAFGGYLDLIIASLEEELGTSDERDEMADWMHAARERMGDEQFEELMAMRGGIHGMRGGMHGGFGHGHFGGGFPGFGHERHGGRHPFGGPSNHGDHSDHCDHSDHGENPHDEE